MKEKNNIVGLHKDKVKVKSFNPMWKKEFEKERKALRKFLGAEVKIEHIGSTAVLGLSAKPIIDIAVGVGDDLKIKEVAEILAQNGYETQNNMQTRGEFLAKKGSPENRTHYIHICKQESQRFKNYILFKNYLMLNPKYIKKYQNLKTKMAKKYADNRKEYSKKKEKLIEKILQLANKKTLK